MTQRMTPRRFVQYTSFTAFILLGIIAVALYFRTLNTHNWDNRHGLHPDERFVQATIEGLRVPRSLGAYFTSVCPSPLPNPRNPEAPPDKQEPSKESGCSTLNPRNFQWSHRFVYGTLPTSLVRITAEAIDRTGYAEIVVVGRVLAAIFDVITLLALFALGRRLYGRTVGLLAAALYACAVMPIQQAHFLTTDSFGLTFVTLALLYAVRMAQTARWRDAVLLGVWIGAAIACKVNLAAVGAVALVAAVLVGMGKEAQQSWHGHRSRIYAMPSGAVTGSGARPERWRKAALLLLVVGACTVLTFRVAQPDAFRGPYLWSVDLQAPGIIDKIFEPRFASDIRGIVDYANGTVDWPPNHQWAGYPPYLFALRNMVQWGMGLPLGLAAWVAWAVIGFLLVRRRTWKHLIPWCWVSLYWAWQGAGFSPFMRYFLPIYPPLILFAAWGTWTLGAVARRSRATTSRRWLNRAAVVTAPLLLVLTFGWAWAFTRIYTRPHPRVEAAAWARNNLPPGATITTEQWDDPLPGIVEAGMTVLETHPYAEDEPAKFLGRPGDETQPGLINILARTDYVALSSARVYGSVIRLPHRFPATIRYYQALFDGSLGFDLIADFGSLPTVLGLPINDMTAEESFTVYDHPRVLIFRRTDHFNVEQARRLLLDGIVWDEVYQVSAKQTNAAPTMLRLPERAWNALSTTGADWMLGGPSGIGAVLVWLLALELLGLAAWGMLWHFQIPLGDRGLATARLLGLVGLAAPPALLATVGSVSRTLWAAWYGFLIAFGLRLAWTHRREMAQWLRANRAHALSSQLIYGGVFIGGLLLRLLHPSFVAPEEQLRLAQWTALVRSPVLPPYDPLFVGGQLTVPYAALLPFAGLAKLTGLGGPVALNLVLPTLLALFALGVWSILTPTMRRITRPAEFQPDDIPPLPHSHVGSGEHEPTYSPSSEYPVPTDVDGALADIPTGVASPDGEETGGQVGARELRQPERRPARARRSIFVGALGIALAVMPGLPLGAARTWGPLGALLHAQVGMLAALTVMAAAVGLGLQLVRAARAQGVRANWKLLTLWGLVLAPLAGHETVLFGIVWLLIASIGLVTLHARRQPWLFAVALVGLVSAAIAQPWSASIAPRMAVGVATLSPGVALGGVVFAGVFALLALVRPARRLVEPWLGGAVAALVIAWGLYSWATLRGAPIAAGSGSPPSRVFTSPLIFLPLIMALLWILALIVNRALAAGRPGAPGFGPSTRRGVQCVLTLLATSLLLAFATRPPDGEVMTDPGLLLGAAALLLVVATGSVLRQLLLSRQRIVQIAAGGLALLLATTALFTLLTTPALRADSARGSLAPALEGVQRALTTIAQDAEGTPVVVAGSPGDELPASITYGGFPTLLGARETARQLRLPAVPSIDRAIGGRERALTAVYGADAEAARQVLETYQVDYVVVSDVERERFGPQAGSALATLTTGQTLKQLFAEGATVVYRVNGSAEPDDERTPPFVATQPRFDVPPITGMLDRPIREMPQVDDYAWNSLANRSQPLAVALWLLFVELLGVMAWPLTRRVFGRWLGGGWGWSKLIGLLLWGYVVWLLTSMQLLVYSWLTLFIGAAIVVAGLAFLHGWRGFKRGVPLSAIWGHDLRRHRRDILRTEALFIGSYLVWVGIRALNPDLWHPTLGGEKPFEFGFLNAILRSPYMPPADPFFSGGVINYYYYGLFLVSLPIKATGIAPAIAFNLAVPMLFAFAMSCSAVVVHELTGQWRWGLLGALFVTILGPVGSAYQIGSSKGIGFLLSRLGPGLRGFGARIGDWFWGPSRIIDTPLSRTINEFPFFSYLFADLHPHMIALPITILAVGLAYELARRAGYHGYQRGNRALMAPLALGALVIGTLAVANSWDAPTYALVLGGALVGSTWRVARLQPFRVRGWWRTTSLRLAIAAAQATAVLVAGLVLFLPFFLQFEAQVGGIGRIQATDTIGQWLALFGAWVFVGISLLLSIGGFVLRRVRWQSRQAVQRGAVVASVLLGLLLLSAATWQQPPTGSAWALRTFLGVLAGAAVILALVARLRDEEWMTVWIFTVGVLVALAIQFVYVRDHLDGSLEWQRMNTVFKFGYQTWTLLALAAAAAVPIVLRVLRQVSPTFQGIWMGGLLLLAGAGAVYPLAGIPSRLGVRFDKHPGPTLDGLAFLEQAEYNNDNHQIALADDRAGIDWLNSKIAGLRVVLHSEREFYRAYGLRIAANTGLPTILGNSHEAEQRDPRLVEARARDVNTLLNTPDPSTAIDLLARYAVDYVYIGPAERAFSEPAGLAKWDQMIGQTLDVVFEHGSVRIYRVRAGLKPTGAAGVPPPAVAAPPPEDDAELKAVEAQNAADPSNGRTAFDLAYRYMRLDRLEDAARVVRIAAAANPADIGVHHLLGDIEARLGNHDAAIAAWEHPITIDRSWFNLFKLGSELIKFERWDQAERALLDARSIDPQQAEPIFALGELYFTRNGEGDAQRAIAAYEEFLRVAPGDAPQRPQAERRLEELR